MPKRLVGIDCKFVVVRFGEPAMTGEDGWDMLSGLGTIVAGGTEAAWLISERSGVFDLEGI